jgi:hypothetical protein
VRWPLVVQRGSVEQDAVVKVEAAFNDPLRALAVLTAVYDEAWAKISALISADQAGQP